MILVVFGNVPIPFPRLAEKIGVICGHSRQRFVIQRGYTQHSFPGAQVYDFVSAAEMARLMGEASLIITHGGYGTISEAMRLGKRIIAVPRLEKEHNHSQRELVEALERAGCLLAVYDMSDLESKIEEAGSFFPRPMQAGNASQLINEFIAREFPGG